MKSLSFIWDDAKAKKNQRKHNVAFEEALTVFTDPNARMIFDTEHSTHEDRFLLLGISVALRMLVVCHCFKEGNNVIRIISARKATKQEQQQYGSFLS